MSIGTARADYPKPFLFVTEAMSEPTKRRSNFPSISKRTNGFAGADVPAVNPTVTALINKGAKQPVPKDTR